MATTSLSSLAGLENLKRWIRSFRSLVSQLNNTKILSGSGPRAKRSTVPDTNRNASAAFSAWLAKYKFYEILGERITLTSGGPASLPIDLRTFSKSYLTLRTQLPGLLNSAGINPSESAAAIADLDSIYNRFVLPYISS